MASDSPRAAPATCAVRVLALSALADGALLQAFSTAEARELEQHLAGCARCSARLLALRDQGEALRERLLARGGALDLTGFADRVLRAVETDRRPVRLGERAKVISLEQWALHRQFITAAAGVALAASVLLGVVLQPVQRRAPPELLAQASVDFLELDGQAGAVLESPGQTTVIWVNEEVTR